MFVEGQTNMSVRADHGVPGSAEGEEGEEGGGEGGQEGVGEVVGEEEGEGKGGEGGNLKGKRNPNGKGMGGKWLFVSHEPVDVPVGNEGKREPLTRMFGLERVRESNGEGLGRGGVDGDARRRYVRFAFEPMVSCRVISSMISPSMTWSSNMVIPRHNEMKKRRHR